MPIYITNHDAVIAVNDIGYGYIKDYIHHNMESGCWQGFDTPPDDEAHIDDCLHCRASKGLDSIRTIRNAEWVSENDETAKVALILSPLIVSKLLEAAAIGQQSFDEDTAEHKEIQEARDATEKAMKNYHNMMAR